MKCLILAAGYATRLYPLTLNEPKPLLPVGGRPILDWLMDDLSGIIDDFIVVTNHRFFSRFTEWADARPQQITVLDDGSKNNGTRLGAVRDIQYAVDARQIRDDLLVAAGDNLLDFSLHGFIRYFEKKKTTCVMRYWENDREKLQKTGVLTADENDRILEMREKPIEPQTHWASPPFYIYRSDDLCYVKEAIDTGCPTDAPGSLIGWLIHKVPVHAFLMPGQRYDIGDLNSYQNAQKEYRGIAGRSG